MTTTCASAVTKQISVFRVRLPPPPPTFLRKSAKSPLISRRLYYFSTAAIGSWSVQQPNRRIECRWTEMHVALRRHQILMPREFLNRLRRCPAHRQMRTELSPPPWPPLSDWTIASPRSLPAEIGRSRSCDGMRRTPNIAICLGKRHAREH